MLPLQSSCTSIVLKSLLKKDLRYGSVLKCIYTSIILAEILGEKAFELRILANILIYLVIGILDQQVFFLVT